MRRLIYRTTERYDTSDSMGCINTRPGDVDEFFKDSDEDSEDVEVEPQSTQVVVSKAPAEMVKTPETASPTPPDDTELPAKVPQTPAAHALEVNGTPTKDLSKAVSRRSPRTSSESPGCMKAIKTRPKPRKSTSTEQATQSQNQQSEILPTEAMSQSAKEDEAAAESPHEASSSVAGHHKQIEYNGAMEDLVETRASDDMYEDDGSSSADYTRSYTMRALSLPSRRSSISATTTSQEYVDDNFHQESAGVDKVQAVVAGALGMKLSMQNYSNVQAY